MHKYLTYAAYGWLALSGCLHFFVDVVSQQVRGKRLPSVETTLYYGLNSAFSLGQVTYGLLGLLIALRYIEFLDNTSTKILSLAAAFGWLAITFFFMEHWEPKMNVAIFCLLVIAAICTAP